MTTQDTHGQDTVTLPMVELAAMPPKLASAWAKAWGELTDPAKDRTASIDTRSGGNYSYDYATLDRINDTVRPTLAKHGLAPLGRLWTDGEAMCVQTILVHESGETFDSGTIRFRYVADPKANGSNHTYYRRYQLLGLLALAPGVDDDGEVATAAARRNHSVGSGQPVSRGPNPKQVEAIANAATIAEDAEMLRKVYRNARDAEVMDVDVAPYVGAEQPITMRQYILNRGEVVKQNEAAHGPTTQVADEPPAAPETPEVGVTREEIQGMTKAVLKRMYAKHGQEWTEQHETDLGEAREWLATVLGL